MSRRNGNADGQSIKEGRCSAESLSQSHTRNQTTALPAVMKFSAYAYLLAAATAVLAAPSSDTSGSATVSYDQTYDNPNGDLNTVACSNGPNGLLTKGELLVP